MRIDEIKPPDQSAEKQVFSAQLDKRLVERLNKTAANFGWGSKRKIIEHALTKVLDELEVRN